MHDVDDAALNQAFARKGQSDWMRSLKVLSRAQAMCWHALPIKDRRMWLALAQAEDEKIRQAAPVTEKVVWHEQR